MFTEVLRQLKTELGRALSSTDRRAKIQDSDFIIGLMQGVSGAKGNFSLADLRRSTCSFLGTTIGSSAFNERLGTASLIEGLKTVLGILMMFGLEEQRVAFDLSKKLGVREIIGVDASMVTLWDGLSEHFKGTFMTASIKLHLAINLVSGAVKWFELTNGAIHDSMRFPNLVVGALYIFDLGYWSAQRIQEIDIAKSFFLSRVKSNLRFTVTRSVHGFGKSIEGQDLLRFPIKRKRNSIVEVIATLRIDGTDVPFRVLGFWHSTDHSYHWFITNLSCHRSLIYETYRLRWQVELSFKAMKSTLNFDRMPTTNPNTAIALSLLCLINYVFAMIVRDAARTQVSHQSAKAYSASIQRAAKVFSTAATIILEGVKLCHRLTAAALGRIKEKMLPLLEDVFDPNFRSRKTSLKSLKSARFAL